MVQYKLIVVDCFATRQATYQRGFPGKPDPIQKALEPGRRVRPLWWRPHLQETYLTKPVKLLSEAGGNHVIAGDTWEPSLAQYSLVYCHGVQIATSQGLTSRDWMAPGWKSGCLLPGANSNSKSSAILLKLPATKAVTEYNMAVRPPDRRHTFPASIYGDTRAETVLPTSLPSPISAPAVVIGGGASGANTRRITFPTIGLRRGRRNQCRRGVAQGNSLVTIDAEGSMITGNTFAGTTTRTGASLRPAGPDTTISGNTFSSTGLQPATASCTPE